MNNVIDISSYNPSKLNNYFFDNNVWMFLFCTVGDYAPNKINKYSTLLQKLRTRSCTIWINSLVLSEFSNAWLRIEFNKWKSSSLSNYNKDYKKDFIPTGSFINAIEDVKIALKTILALTQRTDDNFNSINLDTLLQEFGTTDFNDAYYLTQAQKNNWIMISDDADLLKNNTLNIKIVTANIR